MAQRGRSGAPAGPVRVAFEGHLTPRQRRIVEFISATVRERGYPPTVREIGEAVGLTSSSSVHAQLANLERRGVLHKDPTKPRAMALAEPKAESVTVPLVGRIAAGAPVLAAQDVEEHLTIPASFTDGSSDHFALRVRGDSMTGAGILDGDVVVVRVGEVADDGDIVAAVLPGPAEDEATVKRLRRSRNRALLVPEREGLDPIEMGPDGRIAGTVVAVLRKL
jgi:repressor LexA